jgi:hypothetical protein
MRCLLPFALCLGALAIGLLFAETAGVSKHTVWVVPWDHEGTLRVEPGDVIEVWTEPLAVIPANLEARLRASKVGQGVELVGEALPHKEGTMERLYFFKAFDPGPATLKVELLNADGTVRETRTYRVEVVRFPSQD